MCNSLRFAASALVLVSMSVVSIAQSDDSPSGDIFIGYYEGTYKATGRGHADATAEVVSQGRGIYRVKVTQASQAHLELYGVAAGPELRINGFSNNISWTGRIQVGMLRLGRTDAHYGGNFSLSKKIQHSPTEGLEPPKNAVVLLPKTAGKADLSAWSNGKWDALDGGVMLVKGGTGDNKTNAVHGDMAMHLEFKTAHMPAQSGQQRSNSGVYFQDRYEVQILDSFGVIPGSGDCGGIYEQSAVLENACYPPGQWQTYDITFTAVRLDKDGKVKKYPTITIKHNGVLIQDAHEFKTVTGGAISEKVAAKDRLRLQDHGNPVEYRNIWWVEK